MSKAKRSTIVVQGASVAVLSQNQQDLISLTDIARFKNPERSGDLVRNWLRNRNTVEFLGIWEKLHNPAFNSVEFDGIKLIRQGLPQPERLRKLNEIAISQMRTLLAANNVKRLK